MKDLKGFILLCVMFIINVILVISSDLKDETNYINAIVSVVLFIAIILDLLKSPYKIPIDISLTIKESDDEIEK